MTSVYENFKTIVREYAFQVEATEQDLIFQEFAVAKGAFKEAVQKASDCGISALEMCQLLIPGYVKGTEYAAKTLEKRTEAKVFRFVKKHEAEASKMDQETAHAALKTTQAALGAIYETLATHSFVYQGREASHASFRAAKKDGFELNGVKFAGFVKFLKKNPELLGEKVGGQYSGTALIEQLTQDNVATAKVLSKIDTVVGKMNKPKKEK